MGTLIVDNYDSFTYNLCHLVGAVTGVAPTVVRNDQPVDLDAYTHVILSPGPGRPERPGDFGICANLIATATIPLLGVCLGHQGICHVHGGTIGPAPHVRHGQTSPIHHDGTDLFAGIPTPFEAVRYHSLTTATLPDTLEPTATTDDGVLMGVRHRTRPQWGVQFHPESIRTEHGHRLLANFLRQPRTRPTVKVATTPATRTAHRPATAASTTAHQPTPTARATAGQPTSAANPPAQHLSAPAASTTAPRPAPSANPPAPVGAHAYPPVSTAGTPAPQPTPTARTTVDLPMPAANPPAQHPSAPAAGTTALRPTRSANAPAHPPAPAASAAAHQRTPATHASTDQPASAASPIGHPPVPAPAAGTPAPQPTPTVRTTVDLPTPPANPPAQHPSAPAASTTAHRPTLSANAPAHPPAPAASAAVHQRTPVTHVSADQPASAASPIAHPPAPARAPAHLPALAAGTPTHQRTLATHAPAHPTAPAVAANPPRPAPQVSTIAHRRVTTDASAEAVFDALYADADHAFWLDSADHGGAGGASGAGGRYSVLGDASGPRARVVTADVTTGTVTVRSADHDETVHSGFFDWLAADLAEHRVAPPDLPFGFALGWVGYLGYELKAECGSPNTHRSEHPDAAMIYADRAIVFDHLERHVHLLALVDDGWFDEVEAKLHATTDNSADLPVPDLGPLRLRHDRAAYLDLIAACQTEITAGETYEVCLTNQLTADGKLDPWPSYRRLRRANPEPFGALLRFGGLSVLSASPERFLRVSADGVAESKPIKGTRPRGATPTEDEALRRDLAESAKDRAENLMIVDLVRNDLGTVAALDGVTATRLFDVETHPTVHQLVSTVHARLRPDRTAVDAVRAAFPGGSMTGAPKLRTMSIIDRLEGGPRGVYSGALGYFSLSGAADLSIVIRTLVAAEDRMSYGVGGAIIALSTPDDEVTETAVKAAPLLRLTGQDFPGEEA